MKLLRRCEIHHRFFGFAAKKFPSPIKEATLLQPKGQFFARAQQRVGYEMQYDISAVFECTRQSFFQVRVHSAAALENVVLFLHFRNPGKNPLFLPFISLSSSTSNANPASDVSTLSKHSSGEKSHRRLVPSGSVAKGIPPSRCQLFHEKGKKKRLGVVAQRRFLVY